MKEADSLYSVIALRIAVVLMVLQVAQFIDDRQQHGTGLRCTETRLSD